MLWFCSSFVITLSCWVGCLFVFYCVLVVHRHLVVFGCILCPRLFGSHCLSLVVWLSYCFWLSCVFGCPWYSCRLWLSLMSMVVYGCICLSLVVFFGLWEFCNHAEWPGGKESWCKYRLCGVYRQGRVNFSAHLQLGQDITIWRAFF